MSVAHHDDVIKSLLARAANANAASKMLEAPKRKEFGSSSVCSVSSQRPKAPLSILEVLCAKANDVEIASKVSEATDQFGKLGRGRHAGDPTKVAATLCVKASSLSWDQKETESIGRDEVSKSYSKTSNASSTYESSTFELSNSEEKNHGAMTPDEFIEMAKGLVTVPSGGSSVSPPPAVVTASRSSNTSCDMSTTSDITDWDFSSRGGSSSSPYDADRVVENVYKLAAADPVLARRIAMAANITKIVEDGYLETADAALLASTLPGGSSMLSPVRESTKELKKGKKTRVREDLPPLQPFMSNPTRMVPPPTILKKKRTKPKKESNANDVASNIRPRRESSRSTQADNGPLCFVQDNPRTHK